MGAPDGYWSLAEAARVLGVQRGRMSALSRSGALEVQERIAGRRRRVYVSHRSVRRLQSARRHASAVKQWRMRRRLAAIQAKREWEPARPLWFMR